MALAAVKEMKTSGQLAAEFGVHPSVIARWKKQLLEGAEGVFAHPGEVGRDREVKEAELFQQIGKLQMELEWLKKKAAAFDLIASQFGGPTTGKDQCQPTVRIAGVGSFHLVLHACQ